MEDKASRLSVLESRTTKLEDSLKDEAITWKGYRKEVHDRGTEYQNNFNTKIDDIKTELTKQTRRIDKVEHVSENIDKVVNKLADKIEMVGGQVAGAINNLEQKLNANTTRQTAIKDVVLFTFKLTAFAATILAILNYKS